MLDNLREDANSSGFFDDDENELPDFLDDYEDEEGDKEAEGDPFAFLSPILMLTPAQRFVLVALLFSAICLIGSMALLVLGKFVIPF